MNLAGTPGLLFTPQQLRACRSAAELRGSAPAPARLRPPAGQVAGRRGDRCGGRRPAPAGAPRSAGLGGPPRRGALPRRPGRRGRGRAAGGAARRRPSSSLRSPDSRPSSPHLRRPPPLLGPPLYLARPRAGGRPAKEKGKRRALSRPLRALPPSLPARLPPPVPGRAGRARRRCSPAEPRCAGARSTAPGRELAGAPGRAEGTGGGEAKGRRERSGTEALPDAGKRRVGRSAAGGRTLPRFGPNAVYLNPASARGRVKLKPGFLSLRGNTEPPN